MSENQSVNKKNNKIIIVVFVILIIIGIALFIRRLYVRSHSADYGRQAIKEIFDDNNSNSSPDRHKVDSLLDIINR